MENIEMFEDLLGKNKDAVEQLKEIILKGFSEAKEVVKKHTEEEHLEDFEDFCIFLDSHIDEYVQLYAEHFDTDEILRLIELENDPFLMRLRKFQIEILQPTIEDKIFNFMEKRDEERREEYRKSLRKPRKEDDLEWGV